MISSIGLVLAIALLLCLFHRGLFPWVVSGAGAFTATVAVIVGGNGVLPFYAAMLAVTALMVIRAPLGLKSLIPKGPGWLPLTAFIVWSLLITLLAPMLFAGIPVLLPRGGIDEQIAAPSPLTYTISNLAQIVYLLLGFATVVFLAKSKKLLPSMASTLFWFGTGLSAMNFMMNRLGIPWPAVFDNSPNVRYISFDTDGVTPRFRGIFAEPSGLALFSLTALVFFVASSFHDTGRARIAGVAGSLLSVFLIVEGASGTAVAGAAVVALVLGFLLLMRFVALRSRWSPVVVVTALVLFTAFLFYGNALMQSVGEIVEVKLDSSSFDVRTAANEMSLKIMVDTLGLGSGLGSSRSGSLYTMLLSCVGVPGLALFLWAMLTLIIGAWREPAWRSTALALAAFLLIKTVSGGNLSDPPLWILSGLCAYATWNPTSEANFDLKESSVMKRT